MQRRILIAVFLGCLTAAPAIFAGEASSRIIDGVNAPASTFPTVGEVGDVSGFHSTGTLISPFHVLTAGHSITDVNGVVIGQADGRFKLNGTIYSTVAVTKHPTYTYFRDQTEGQWDLGVMTLSTPIINVTPSPINRTPPIVGEILTIAGYGYLGTGWTGENGTLPAPGTIQWGTTPLDTLTNTFLKWSFDYTPLNSESNTARGDSGGPAFVTRDGQLFLAGVTSGGTNYNAAFGDNSYDARLDTVWDWLEPYVATAVPPGLQAVGPRPELRVVALSMGGTPVVGQMLPVTATISNSGLADAAGFYASVFLDRTGTIINSSGAASTLYVPGVAAGASINVSFALTYANSGTFSLAIHADSENSILEDNELNNTFLQRVVVLALGSDLVVKSVAKVESPVGTNARFTVIVENRGKTTAASSTLGFYYNRPIAPGGADLADQTVATPALASLGAAVLVCDLPTQSAPRAGRAWFVADQGNAISEDVESNNATSVTWGQANSPVTVLSQLSGGATLTQTGGAAAPGQTFSFSVAASDTDGDALTYLWDFGDGTTLLSGATVTHTFTAPGTYVVTVAVSDGPYSSASQTMVVVVADPSVIDLGSVAAGRISLAVPVPATDSRKDRLKGKIIEGNPGGSVRYTYARLRGKVLEKGEYTFTVEYFSRLRQSAQRVKYKYRVQ